MLFKQFKQKNEFFTKSQAPGILVSILTFTYSLLCLNLLNNFKKELIYKHPVTFIADFCLIFSLWASRALVYNGRNLWIVDLCRNPWIVDLCSIELPWWNWKGVDEAVNSMAILQGGFNFIKEVPLWAHFITLGRTRQTFYGIVD